ncbi:MAG: DNA replication/repair protein RecF [Lachnospiraceae bacterium]|nr:DNA replication/repair protein RecF [Lachnospiraceae bacterium]
MFIKKLELKCYRNYDNLQMTFDRGTNILYGNNAQGKTNVLEAIYICSVTRSHRGSKDREIIEFGEEESHIKCVVEKNGLEDRIDMHLKKNKTKGIAFNGIPLKKSSELFGNVNVVFFSPEDLNIIKNGPGERRRFVDMELCQLDSLYTSDLVHYNKVLAQKNQLLRDLVFRPDWKDTLPVWNRQLIHYGSSVIRRRKVFIKKLNEILVEIHGNLTGKLEKIQMEYEPNVTEEKFAEELVLNEEREQRQKISLTGPHRDDIKFYVNNVDIRRFGSQGQQRTAALSLKLAEIELVKEIIKDTPVLLLDDVLSELDRSRQNHLLNSIKDIQTLITCTGLDDFVNNRFQIDKIFRVAEGTVVSEN